MFGGVDMTGWTAAKLTAIASIRYVKSGADKGVR